MIPALANRRSVGVAVSNATSQAYVNERSRYDSAPFTAGHRDVVEPLLMIARRTMQACQRPMPAGRCNTPSRPSMAPTPMVAILADPYHVAIKSTATLEQWP